MNTFAPPNVRASHVELGQQTLVIALRLSGWMTTTLMATLGVATLLFLILGSFTLSGTMLQLDNLASRYLAADPDRQAQFHCIACAVLVISFALISFLRRASLARCFTVTGGDHD